MPRKLLTSKLLVVLDIKALSSSLKRCKSREEFYEIAPKFDKISAYYNKFRKALDEVTDVKFAAKPSDCVADFFEECSNSHEICKLRYFYRLEDNRDQMAKQKLRTVFCKYRQALAVLPQRRVVQLV